MKIHDLEYSIFRLVRLLRGKLFRARQQRKFRPGNFLRFSGAAFLIFYSLSIVPVEGYPVAGSVTNETTAGEVKGDQAIAAEPTPVITPESSFMPLLTPPPWRLAEASSAAEMTAKAVILYDVPSATILYENNQSLPLPPASTTKIVTALVALNNFSPAEEVIVPAACLNINGSQMSLVADESITVLNLLYGLLVASASDAACALANHGGLTTETFVNLMNEEALRIGTTQTHFTNVIGLDEVNGEHTSTAEDLLKITQAALRNETFRLIVATRNITVSSVDAKKWHTLKTTNELLGSLPGITGVKTGLTEKARGCLIAHYERDGRDLISIVLGSDDRFGETKSLLSWALNSYRWID